MYGNPITWPSVASNDVEELAALNAALALGQILSRVVVLPRFHCSRSAADIGSGSGSASAPRGRGARRFVAARPTVPPSPIHECPLNGLLNVTAFDAQFEGRYRESSFLRHPLVPTAVRDDRSPPQHVHRRLQGSAAGGDGALPSTAVQLSVDDVVGLFGSLRHHVLVFHSLYRVQPRFAGDDEQRTFDDKVRKAFRRGSYRQL